MKWTYLKKEQFDFYYGLVNSTQDELLKQFDDKIAHLEKQSRYNQSDYKEAKLIQNELFRRGWLDENEVATILKAELENDWFSYWGLLAVGCSRSRFIKATNFHTNFSRIARTR